MFAKQHGKLRRVGRHGSVTLTEVRALATYDDKVTVGHSFGVQTQNYLLIMWLIHLPTARARESIDLKDHPCDIE